MDTINELKLELMALQLKDTENALNNGFNNKEDWFKYIINSNNDEIAQATLDLSQRYNVNENILAIHFDPTMLLRINKIKNRKNILKITK